MNVYEYKKKHYRKQAKLQDEIDNRFNDLEYNKEIYLNYEKSKENIRQLNELQKQKMNEHDLFIDSLSHGQCELCCKFTSVRTGGIVNSEDNQFGYETIEIYCEKCRKDMNV